MTPPSVTIEIVYNQAENRYQAFLRGPSGYLLPPIVDVTEEKARTATESILKSPLARALVRSRSLPDSITTRAFAARIAHMRSSKADRTVTSEEILALAKKLGPTAHKLRNLVAEKDKHALWTLLPGARDGFLAALDRLKRPPSALLKELGLPEPSKRGGPITRGSKASRLLQVAAESWIAAFGCPPSVSAQFLAALKCVLAHYRIASPSQFEKWVRREMDKLPHSVLGSS